MTKTTWVRLKEGNDWGYVYYAIEPLAGPFQTASHARGLRFKGGETLRVRRLDGKRKRPCEGMVWFDWRDVKISDMGHDYTTRTRFPKIRIGARNYRPDEVEIDSRCLNGRPLNGDMDEEIQPLDDDPILSIVRATRGLPTLEEQGLGWLKKRRSVRVP